MISFCGAMAVAMAVDAVVGWPDALFRLIGHPVTWIGRLIAALDQRMNLDTEEPDQRRKKGIAAAAIVIVGVAVLGLAIQLSLPTGLTGTIVAGILVWPLLAVRSLHRHVADVAHPLQHRDIAGARQAVAKIVGRDSENLDEAGISRAALESLAENTSDGVIAPLFWGALLGLPGIAAYKAINTLDSMIGHKTPRHLAFGWASARIDDLANYIPARLSGYLFALVCGRPGTAIRCMARDAGKHRSPNAGWPEAAMAGALGVRLSGPRIYPDGVADEPWVNAEAPDPDAGDIVAGLALYRHAMMVVGATLVLLAIF